MYKKVVLQNYANFNGRARRREYWYFTLANIILFICFLIIGGLLGAIFGDAGNGAGIGYVCYIVCSLLTMLPTLAVTVRRLHDTDKSGWFILLGIIPLAGIVLLVFLSTEGTRGPNRYGADPKNEYDELNQVGVE
nr:DUF805 domain-containing protein [Flavobacterium defluvii]